MRCLCGGRRRRRRHRCRSRRGRTGAGRRVLGGRRTAGSLVRRAARRARWCGCRARNSSSRSGRTVEVDDDGEHQLRLARTRGVEVTPAGLRRASRRSATVLSGSRDPPARPRCLRPWPRSRRGRRSPRRRPPAERTWWSRSGRRSARRSRRRAGPRRCASASTRCPQPLRRSGHVGADDVGGVAGAGQDAGQDVHHEGDAVALVAAHRREQPVDRDVRVGGRDAVLRRRPSRRGSVRRVARPRRSCRGRRRCWRCRGPRAGGCRRGWPPTRGWLRQSSRCRPRGPWPDCRWW